jgi:hypothetical protein
VENSLSHSSRFVMTTTLSPRQRFSRPLFHTLLVLVRVRASRRRGDSLCSKEPNWLPQMLSGSQHRAPPWPYLRMALRFRPCVSQSTHALYREHTSGQLPTADYPPEPSGPRHTLQVHTLLTG